jgi:hypothetical protein
MKKILFFISLFCVMFVHSQETKKFDFKRNELKGNALLLILGQPEFSYERILNNESGIGVSVNFALEKDFETTFSLTPYYRFYFGKKPASGFFVEGFAMLNTLDIDDETYISYDYPANTYTTITDKGATYTDFALGFGVGFKLISKRGLVLEANGGIGRNLLNSEKNDYFGHTFVGRGGITVGYRF